MIHHFLVWCIFQVLFPMLLSPLVNSYFRIFSCHCHFSPFIFQWLLLRKVTFYDEFSRFKWMAPWRKLWKNHKVNELKMFHDVYDDYILVKGTLLSSSFACFTFWITFAHFIHFHHSIEIKLNFKLCVLWFRRFWSKSTIK